jgi:hypothetical protein
MAVRQNVNKTEKILIMQEEVCARILLYRNVYVFKFLEAMNSYCMLVLKQ